MFGLGLPELLVILFIVLIVFGAGRLPQLGDALGRTVRNFRRRATPERPLDSDATPRELPTADPPAGDAASRSKQA